MSLYPILQRWLVIGAVIAVVVCFMSCSNSVKAPSSDTVIVNKLQSFNELIDTLVKESTIEFKDIKRGLITIGNNGLKEYASSIIFNGGQGVVILSEKKAIYTQYLNSDLDSLNAADLFKVDAGDVKVCLSDWGQKDSINKEGNFSSHNYYRNNTEVKLFLRKDNDSTHNYDVGLQVENIH